MTIPNFKIIRNKIFYFFFTYFLIVSCSGELKTGTHEVTKIPSSPLPASSDTAGFSEEKPQAVDPEIEEIKPQKLDSELAQDILHCIDSYEPSFHIFTVFINGIKGDISGILYLNSSLSKLESLVDKFYLNYSWGNWSSSNSICSVFHEAKEYIKDLRTLFDEVIETVPNLNSQNMHIDVYTNRDIMDLNLAKTEAFLSKIQKVIAKLKEEIEEIKNLDRWGYPISSYEFTPSSKINALTSNSNYLLAYKSNKDNSDHNRDDLELDSRSLSLLRNLLCGLEKIESILSKNKMESDDLSKILANIKLKIQNEEPLTSDDIEQLKIFNYKLMVYQTNKMQKNKLKNFRRGIYRLY